MAEGELFLTTNHCPFKRFSLKIVIFVANTDSVATYILKVIRNRKQTHGEPRLEPFLQLQ